MTALNPSHADYRSTADACGYRPSRRAPQTPAAWLEAQTADFHKAADLATAFVTGLDGEDMLTLTNLLLGVDDRDREELAEQVRGFLARNW